jgi:hypothetical protein
MDELQNEVKREAKRLMTLSSSEVYFMVQRGEVNLDVFMEYIDETFLDGVDDALRNRYYI